MADREVAGRCTCPICGEPLQDIRVNVNQKLYCYCDNGCSFKFNSAQSRKFLPELRSGRNVATAQGITIFSTVGKDKTQNEESKITRVQRAGGIAGGIAGAELDSGRRQLAGNTGINGRIDAGRRSANAGVEQRANKRGFIAAWLGDDDDDD